MLQLLDHLVCTTAIYVILGHSLCLVAGFAGIMSLSHAGLYGVGAYTVAILGWSLGTPALVSLPVAVLVTGVVGAAVAIIVGNLEEDEAIVATLGIQVILFTLMTNIAGVTGGALGLQNKTFDAAVFSHLDYQGMLTSIFLMIAVWLVVYRVSGSRFGLILIGLSEDEEYMQTIGKDTLRAKVWVFALGGALAAVGGAIFSWQVMELKPESFKLEESILILSIVLVGGMTNLRGIALAAALLVVFPVALRMIGVGSSLAANIRQILYGALLAAIMIVRARNRVVQDEAKVVRAGSEAA